MTFSCDFILIMSSKFDNDSIDKSKQRERQRVLWNSFALFRNMILFGSSLDQSCWNLYIRGVLARQTVTNEATKAQVKRGTSHEMS